jgi:hypothetical protein
MHLLTQSKNNVAALELMRHLGVRYKTAWLVKHKLMEVMRVREDDRQLDGRVELDDAYLGGERSGGKAGRDSENKVPFVCAQHERVVTGGGKASSKLPQFKAVNTFLGNLKRSLSGTYQAFHLAKYAQRFLAEAQYRFNRRFKLRSIMARPIARRLPFRPRPGTRHSCR